MNDLPAVPLPELPPGIDRTNPEVWRQLAWQAVEAGRTPEAIACFCEVTRLAPQLVEAWANAGALLARSGRNAEAVGYYREAVAREPQNVGLRKALLRSLRDDGDREAALAECQAALAMSPNEGALHQQLGNLLQELDHYDAALDHLQRAIALDGRTPSLVCNVGIAQFRRGDIDEAIASFREAIQQQPSFADARFYLGMALLLQGDYAAGWPEYEWRPGGRRRPNPAPLPMWQGESLEGKTLLLAAEQGYGDTIQFIRFASLVKERYQCRTLLYCQTPLIPLLRTCAGVDEFVPRDAALPQADCFIPLMSIPSVLGFDPEKEAAPGSYLATEESRVASWRQKLPLSQSRRIGISWQGDPKFPADRCRSIPLKQFLPLAALPGIELVSLQKGFGTEQLADFRPHAIVDFGDDLDRAGGAFLDTAAIMQSLDLIVTSDSAVAHLAGALGVPTAILLPHVPDWRWHLQRADSPWYPSARLFRQQHLGQWEPVVEEIVGILSPGSGS